METIEYSDQMTGFQTAEIAISTSYWILWFRFVRKFTRWLFHCFY